MLGKVTFNLANRKISPLPLLINRIKGVSNSDPVLQSLGGSCGRDHLSLFISEGRMIVATPLLLNKLPGMARPFVYPVYSFRDVSNDPLANPAYGKKAITFQSFQYARRLADAGVLRIDFAKGTNLESISLILETLTTKSMGGMEKKFKELEFAIEYQGGRPGILKRIYAYSRKVILMNFWTIAPFKASRKIDFLQRYMKDNNLGLGDLATEKAIPEKMVALLIFLSANEVDYRMLSGSVPAKVMQHQPHHMEKRKITRGYETGKYEDVRVNDGPSQGLNNPAFEEYFQMVSSHNFRKIVDIITTFKLSKRRHILRCLEKLNRPLANGLRRFVVSGNDGDLESFLFNLSYRNED